MTILNQYANHFAPAYSNYPQGRYVTLIIARWIESEAIFRTEGSGEPLNKEFVHAGISHPETIQRVVISKRKQTAVERRTGRELLRRHDLLFESKPNAGICALNRNNPCEKCLDCMIYGYAAGGGGAQKARVITDDAFSLHPAQQITDEKTFNAPFDNSSPWERDTSQDSKGKQMTGLGQDEYVRPQAVFVDMETIKDVTIAEFQYILGNVLRSSRYGAISSRIGKVQNELLVIVFSDCELFSNLELTQVSYDRLVGDNAELDFPLSKDLVHQAVQEAATSLMGRVVGQTTTLSSTEVAQLRQETVDLYSNEAGLVALLQETGLMYGPQ